MEERERKVYDALNALGIAFERHEHPPVFTVEAVPVEGAGCGLSHTPRKETARFGAQHGGVAGRAGGVLQHDVDARALGCPETEVDTTVRRDLGSDRQPAPGE